MNTSIPPGEGGSYREDPATGARTLIERTRPAGNRAERATASVTAATAVIDPDAPATTTNPFEE